MPEKETVMVLKVVDLQCPCCSNKLKKILCEFPQVRDQVYNKKANTVTITVICCNPQKIRDRLFCKGSRLIKTIEIKEPPNPPINVVPDTGKTGERPDDKDDPKHHMIDTMGTKPSSLSTRMCCQQCREGQGGGPCNHGRGARKCCQECSEGREGGPCNQGQGARTCCQECSEGRGGGPCNHGHRTRTCCQECSEGRGGGPCNHGQRPRTCCQQCYEGHSGGPCYHGLEYHPYQPHPCSCGCGGYGYGNGNRGGYHYYCYTEESPQNCSIM